MKLSDDEEKISMKTGMSECLNCKTLAGFSFHDVVGYWLVLECPHGMVKL